jgi:transcriptional regulator with XRE-family HTH domain
MQELREQFAKNLVHHRQRKGLSQEQLADESEMNRTAISRLECRERTPRLETVVKLSRGLKLASLCELLEGIH